MAKVNRLLSRTAELVLIETTGTVLTGINDLVMKLGPYDKGIALVKLGNFSVSYSDGAEYEITAVGFRATKKNGIEGLYIVQDEEEGPKNIEENLLLDIETLIKVLAALEKVEAYKSEAISK